MNGTIFPVTFQAHEVEPKRRRHDRAVAASHGAPPAPSQPPTPVAAVANPPPQQVHPSVASVPAVATPSLQQVVNQAAPNAMLGDSNVVPTPPTNFIGQMAALVCQGVASGEVNQSVMAGILSAFASGSLANLSHQQAAASTSGSSVAAGSAQQSASTAAATHAPAPTDGAGGQGAGNEGRTGGRRERRKK